MTWIRNVPMLSGHKQMNGRRTEPYSNTSADLKVTAKLKMFNKMHFLYAYQLQICTGILIKPVFTN